MNREIKFRGKSIDNGKWLYGSLISTVSGNCYILDYRTKDVYKSQLDFVSMMIKNYGGFAHNCEVDPKTVGQYIGIEDNNKIEIYDGDILKFKDNSRFETQHIEYVQFDTAHHDFYPFSEIIGNIHDNPELLEINNERK